jgi:hypothetical protein
MLCTFPQNSTTFYTAFDSQLIVQIARAKSSSVIQLYRFVNFVFMKSTSFRKIELYIDPSSVLDHILSKVTVTYASYVRLSGPH